MGSANGQSPLCCQEAAKNDARWCAEARLASTLALDSSTPGRSQIGCLVGSMSGTSPNLADQIIIIIIVLYCTFNALTLLIG